MFFKYHVEHAIQFQSNKPIWKYMKAMLTLGYPSQYKELN